MFTGISKRFLTSVGVPAALVGSAFLTTGCGAAKQASREIADVFLPGLVEPTASAVARTFEVNCRLNTLFRNFSLNELGIPGTEQGDRFVRKVTNSSKPYISDLSLTTDVTNLQPLAAGTTPEAQALFAAQQCGVSELASGKAEVTSDPHTGWIADFRNKSGTSVHVFPYEITYPSSAGAIKTGLNLTIYPATGRKPALEVPAAKHGDLTCNLRTGLSTRYLNRTRLGKYYVVLPPGFIKASNSTTTPTAVFTVRQIARGRGQTNNPWSLAQRCGVDTRHITRTDSGGSDSAMARFRTREGYEVSVYLPNKPDGVWGDNAAVDVDETRYVSAVS